MKTLKYKVGFTLIEIIVVLIILGVLAVIALPSLYSWIERSKAAEAFAALKTYKDQAQACIELNSGQESVCQGGVNFQDSNNFSYGFGLSAILVNSQCQYRIINGPISAKPQNGSKNFAVIACNKSTGEWISIFFPTAFCSTSNIYNGLC